MSDADEAIHGWTVVARLVRPQGRHGEILADLLTDFPERFGERKRLFLIASETASTPAREMMLERHWLHKGRVVLKFSGIDSISNAELLRDLMVAIPTSERIPLSDGAAYISDLVGCEIVDVANSAVCVGKITDVDRDAGLLMVKSMAGGEILIPFAKAYLVGMDLAAKRIEMRLPGGLLDINAPLTEEERRTMNATGEDSEDDGK
jgi:16S rRNA processing protein RimM